MKTIHLYINEKLKINKDTNKFTLFPKTVKELKEMIKEEMEKNGVHCSLNHIDISALNNLNELFMYSDFDGDISGWDTSNILQLSHTFAYSSFTGKYGDISKWDVSSVKLMRGIFYGAHYNGDISDWDVSNVINFRDVFFNSKFDGDLSKWDVSSAENMQGMFNKSYFTGHKGDIANWDVSNVTDMTSMFKENVYFNGDITKWNVSNVTSMEGMFRGSSYVANLSKWVLNSKCSTTNMFVDNPIGKDSRKVPQGFIRI